MPRKERYHRNKRAKQEARDALDPNEPRPLMINRYAPTKEAAELPSGKKIVLTRKKAFGSLTFTTEMREQYLTLIRDGVTNKDAAAACGCSSNYFSRRRAIDPEFERLYQEAREDGNDTIRAEVHRRAITGVKRAIYHDGKVVGYKREYSDQLLMFLAKSRMPEFKDAVQVDHNHKFEGAAEQLANKLSGILGLPAPDEIIDVTPEEDDEAE